MSKVFTTPRFVLKAHKETDNADVTMALELLFPTIFGSEEWEDITEKCEKRIETNFGVVYMRDDWNVARRNYDGSVSNYTDICPRGMYKVTVEPFKIQQKVKSAPKLASDTPIYKFSRQCIADAYEDADNDVQDALEHLFDADELIVEGPDVELESCNVRAVDLNMCGEAGELMRQLFPCVFEEEKSDKGRLININDLEIRRLDSGLAIAEKGKSHWLFYVSLESEDYRRTTIGVDYGDGEIVTNIYDKT